MFRCLLPVAATTLALATTPPAQAQAASTMPSGTAPAVIADTSVGGGNRGAIFFFIAEIDGEQPLEDVERISSRASLFMFPRGYTAPADVRRDVQPGLRRLVLVGKHSTNDLFQNLAGGLPKVSGTVEVDLLPGKRYRVNGVVDAFRREVWLQDEDGIVPNTRIVDNKVREANKGDMAGAKYTCCNLHYEQDWISDANFVTLPMIPAGARIVVKSYGHHRAHVLIDGEPMRFGLDYGRKRETPEQFVAKLIVAEDPRQRLAGYEPVVREAIERGRVVIGMTREQVLMALGHPRTDLNASLDAPRWVYVTYQHDEYAIVWGPDGRVRAVESEEEGAKLDVLYTPR